MNKTIYICTCIYITKYKNNLRECSQEGGPKNTVVFFTRAFLYLIGVVLVIAL
jgi:hypothetical protein